MKLDGFFFFNDCINKNVVPINFKSYCKQHIEYKKSTEISINNVRQTLLIPDGRLI